MARILYVAGNREGSYYQLKRYLPLFLASKHTFQIAGYKSSVKELNADYCLDSLLSFTRPNEGINFNGNFSYYSKEVSKFSPDLVISDFDIYSSILAVEKNIPLWQVSPGLLYYSLPAPMKEKTGISMFNKRFVGKNRTYIDNILNNSTRKMILSHLCDIADYPKISSGFEFCRPEFVLDEDRSSIASSVGLATELADAFYNERYTLLNLKWQDIETVSGIYGNIHYDLGQFDFDELEQKKIKIQINESVRFLMEAIN